MMGFCKNCGQELKANAAFCASCGTQQTATKQYCPNCGNQISGNQLSCPSCGTGINQFVGRESNNVNTISTQKMVNTTWATIVGYLLPGLPSLLWLNQTTKGIVMLVLTILALIFIPVLGNIVIGIFGAVDAYKLSIRVNSGKRLEDWTFFFS